MWRTNGFLSKTHMPNPLGLRIAAKGKAAFRGLSYLQIRLYTELDEIARAITGNIRIEQEKLFCLSTKELFGDPERTRTVDLQRDRLAC